MKIIEEKVRKAKAEKKIFIIIGKYEAIRKGLIDRGWLEKVLENQMMYILPSSERLLIASFLKNSDYNFIWQPKLRPIKTDEAKKHIVNSIIRQRIYDFTTKDGLKNCVDSFPWNCISGVTELNYYPRTHILIDKSEKDDFFEDFRQIAFISFIKFLNSFENISELFSIAGSIPLESIDFAIQKIELLFKIEEHEDIDMSRIFDACAKYPKDQRKVLNHIHQMINGNRKFILVDQSIIEQYTIDIKSCAIEIEQRWPHLKYDGYTNTWIFKPIGSSSGNGIILENNVHRMREFLSTNAYKTFLIQKYIERPMLIHGKKFDIRIYLLTTIQNGSVHVWLYKDCYVKFATKNFKLNDLHKSIHVTNYAVQKHYMNDQDAVPYAVENMWTLRQLIEYFGTIEQPRLWEAKIYPAIKKILLAVIIPSLEVTKIENNNFELNGADFMVICIQNLIFVAGIN
ncbi:tubulin glycylase 3B-like [Chironomus tepperi]|uniref:tubulin glycylase 3B-like n=1 Tax=Chironomus tepperi TaxID=113505 RepID=UPI00391EEB04